MSYFYDQRILFQYLGRWIDGRYENKHPTIAGHHLVNSSTGRRVVTDKDLKPFSLNPDIVNYKAGEDIEYLHPAGQWLTGTYHKPSPNGTHHKIWRVSGMSDSFHYSRLRTPERTETKEPTMTIITKKSTKAELLLAYNEAQRKLDNILPLIREYDAIQGLDLCENGIEEFCDDVGIEYTLPVKELTVNLSVSFVESGQINDYGSLSDEAIIEITKKIDKILEAAGVSADVNYDDSYQ